MANPATRRFEYFLSRVVQSVRNRTVNPSNKLGDYTAQEDRMSSRFAQNVLNSSESTRKHHHPPKAVLSQE